MEVVEHIISAALKIYKLVEKVKINKNRCRCISQRVKQLEELVKAVKERDAVKVSPQVKNALQELSTTLDSAQELIDKYTKDNWIKRLLKTGSHEEEFDTVNKQLTDAFQILSEYLNLEQSNAMYELFKLAKDAEAWREDDEEIKKSILDYEEAMKKELEEVKTSVKIILKILAERETPREEIRKIKPEELTYIPQFPKKPILTTPTSEVFKGQYCGFTVAIKKYKVPSNTDLKNLEDIFNKEVGTLKEFESPNILRMFGICILDRDTQNPQYLIIQEYCEKGTLRDVLSSACELSWPMKVRMCLDAARGLFRLHQTEAKSKVHGNINSSKFLVAEGYLVKLGGFELTQTETTLKNATKEKSSAISSLCYTSPQRLESIHHKYNKQCEIYSFGIVLWEITTRKNPFEGFTDVEIYKKVCNSTDGCPLDLSDIPKPLQTLISTCTAYNAFDRPSAGVLRDELCKMELQSEEQ
ncbi:mixed lineage kinase domain-like protein [Melanotaenia boesemani]|uniref:mixed lineage kinase domain-like protein n=1 Tax=Melanotaenia boesemani TaxID=1250792 RepID=UPI001C04B41A|nr:mixed lineage kinase domain-like protein [Melanotaenia boesemani]